MNRESTDEWILRASVSRDEIRSCENNNRRCKSLRPHVGQCCEKYRNYNQDMFRIHGVFLISVICSCVSGVFGAKYAPAAANKVANAAPTAAGMVTGSPFAM